MPQPPKTLTPSNSAQELFGSEVRRYRSLAGMSIAKLADLVPYSASFIGAVERGDCGCERGFAEACDERLDTRDALVHLHDGLFGKKIGGFPEWFQKWTHVEEQAGTLKAYGPLVVYGLLQTVEYATTLLFGDAERIEGRMARQQVLTRTDPRPPRVIYVLPESVLWYDVGGPEVMRNQLEWLSGASTARVSVQVVPNGVAHPGNEGGFVLATLPDGRELAFVETAARGIMLDSREDITELKDAFDAICTQALPTGLSSDLIRRTIEERWKA